MCFLRGLVLVGKKTVTENELRTRDVFAHDKRLDGLWFVCKVVSRKLKIIKSVNWPFFE